MTDLVESLVVGQLGCNCSIVTGPSGKEAIVVDPGDEAPRILEVIKAHGLEVCAIVHTHAHVDHIMGTGLLAAETGAPIWLHESDLFLYDELPSQGKWIGYRNLAPPPKPDHFYEQGDRVALGDGASLEVLHTPGHTPGSVCFLGGQGTLLFSGDTLFQHGIGRTDLPGGSFSQLMASIESRLLSLPGETRVLPGHGPATTIGDELLGNPWLQQLR